MPEPIAVAFVEIRPDTTGFQSQTEADVKRSLASAPANIAVASNLGSVKGELAAVTAEAGALTAATADTAAGLASIEAEGAATVSTLKSVGAEFSDLLARNRALQSQSAQFIADQRAISAAAEGEVVAVTSAAAAETELAAARTRAGSAGPGGLGIGRTALGFGALFVGVQALQQLSASLKVSGNEASTFTGKMRNLGASVLSGDIVGAFKALTNSAHDFSIEELVIIERSPKLVTALKAIGKGGDLAKGQLKGLQSLTQVPAEAQLRVTQAQFSGSSSDQLRALQDEDEQVKQQIAKARAFGQGSAGLAVALNDLIKKRIEIRDRIAQLTDRQRASVLAPLAESVTDARLTGDARRIVIALTEEAFVLRNVLIPLAASASARRDFKDKLLSINQEIEQAQADIAAEVKRHHDAMISSLLQPSGETITDTQLTGSRQAELAALQGRAGLLRILIAVETDRDKREELKNELISVNSQAEAIQQQIADEAKRHAQAMNDSAAKTRQAFLDSLGLQDLTLETALQRAQLAGNIALQERLLQARIDFFKKEESLFGLATAAGQQAAQNEIAATRALRDLRHQVLADQINAREQELRDNVTLAGFTEKITSDDAAALRKLIAFEDKQSRNKKLSVAERRKHLIAEKQAEKDLRDLLKQSSSGTDDFAKLSFQFLQTQHGFAANLAGNLLGNTAGLVGGTQPPPSVAPPITAEVPLPPHAPSPLPSGRAVDAEVTRDAGGRAPTSTQLETLIHVNREMLTQIKLLRASAAHPEARTSRQLAGAATETSPP